MVNAMSLKLRRKLSKSGRSLVLRIPRDIERSLKLSDKTNVDVWIEKDSLIMKPLEKDD